MQPPSLIELNSYSLLVLRTTVLALSPQEGCALLIGDQFQAKPPCKESKWRIHLIWPCCNIWEPDIFNLDKSNLKERKDQSREFSKENRFAIDPREQLHAQKWSRKRNWKILGSAHSHPIGQLMPSTIDFNWSFQAGVMLIVDKSQAIKAWWIENNKNFLPINLLYLDD